METSYTYLIFIAPTQEVARLSIDALLAKLPSYSGFGSFGPDAYRHFRLTGRKNAWGSNYGEEMYPSLPEGDAWYGELSKIPLTRSELKEILVRFFSEWEERGIYPAVCQIAGGRGPGSHVMLYDHRVGEYHN
jgi:hypothetical protein